MDFLFQLYSARNTPLDQSLRIVAEAGYVGVEAYGENFNDERTFSEELEKHALIVPSMHISLDMLRNDLPSCLARARHHQCSHVVCPHLVAEERPDTAEQWQALGYELADLQAQCAEAGCTFAWHNHDFEFVALADGSLPIQHLLDTATAMQWEIDVAWVVRAGVEPAAWIDRYLSRISAVHLKDIAPAGACIDEDGWADLGDGIVPWSALMPRLMKSPASLYIVEHDKPSDLQRFARRSMAAAQALRA